MAPKRNAKQQVPPSDYLDPDFDYSKLTKLQLLSILEDNNVDGYESVSKSLKNDILSFYKLNFYDKRVNTNNKREDDIFISSTNKSSNEIPDEDVEINSKSVIDESYDSINIKNNENKYKSSPLKSNSSNIYQKKRGSFISLFNKESEDEVKQNDSFNIKNKFVTPIKQKNNEIFTTPKLGRDKLNEREANKRFSNDNRNKINLEHSIENNVKKKDSFKKINFIEYVPENYEKVNKHENKRLSYNKKVNERTKEYEVYDVNDNRFKKNIQNKKENYSFHGLINKSPYDKKPKRYSERPGNDYQINNLEIERNPEYVRKNMKLKYSNKNIFQPDKIINENDTNKALPKFKTSDSSDKIITKERIMTPKSLKEKDRLTEKKKYQENTTLKNIFYIFLFLFMCVLFYYTAFSDDVDENITVYPKLKADKSNFFDSVKKLGSKTMNFITKNLKKNDTKKDKIEEEIVNYLRDVNFKFKYGELRSNKIKKSVLEKLFLPKESGKIKKKIGNKDTDKIKDEKYNEDSIKNDSVSTLVEVKSKIDIIIQNILNEYPDIKIEKDTLYSTKENINTVLRIKYKLCFVFKYGIQLIYDHFLLPLIIIFFIFYAYMIFIKPSKKSDINKISKCKNKKWNKEELENSILRVLINKAKLAKISQDDEEENVNLENLRYMLKCDEKLFNEVVRKLVKEKKISKIKVDKEQSLVLRE